MSKNEPWHCYLKLRKISKSFALATKFFKKWANPVLFCLFSLFSWYNFNNTNWKKHRWCAWDSNPGLQDGRRRRNHRAMAATKWPLNFHGRLCLFLTRLKSLIWPKFSCLKLKVGRRRCVGEDFGKIMLFAFVTRLIQTFKINFTSEVGWLFTIKITIAAFYVTVKPSQFTSTRSRDW